MRLAILDSDSGFVRVLVKRASDLGWQYRRLEAPPRTEDFVAMRVNALVVDLAVLGPGAWEFLERVCGMLPGLGVIVRRIAVAGIEGMPSASSGIMAVPVVALLAVVPIPRIEKPFSEITIVVRFTESPCC